MKHFISILTILIIVSCDSDNGSDCFKSSGVTTTKTYLLDDFSKIIIHEEIELEIKQGNQNSIEITYGKNVVDNILTEISDDKLEIRNTTCNIFRGYQPAKVVLTATNITEIRNASQFKVFSNEILHFDSLTLISENFFLDVVNVGDFDLAIENNSLNIITNNVSNFYIKGKTNNLDIVFAAGQGKFNGEHLIAKNVHLFHRGINNLIINPIQKLSGEIRGVGDVISVNRPPVVEVTEFYTGRLIFR